MIEKVLYLIPSEIHQNYKAIQVSFIFVFHLSQNTTVFFKEGSQYGQNRNMKRTSTMAGQCFPHLSLMGFFPVFVLFC